MSVSIQINFDLDNPSQFPPQTKNRLYLSEIANILSAQEIELVL